MFAAARLVDSAVSNDDRPISDSTLQEAVTLCQTDPANVAKLVRGCVSKLTNSFVMVRIKALGLLIHVAQNGPASVRNEIAANSLPIAACRTWRGEPHPVRGFEPYDVMREAVDLLLSLTQAPAASPKSRFAKVASARSGPLAPAPAPARPYSSPAPSLTTPYPDQAPPPGAPQGSYSQQPAGGRGPTALENVGAALSGAAGAVASFFKKPFAKRGEFTTFDEPRPQAAAAPDQASFSFSFVPTDAAPPAAPPSPYETRQLTAGSLLDDGEPAPAQRTHARENPLRPARRPPVNLTPAKKLLKVTGGRPLASADELRAFHDALSVESIAELVAGLDDPEWKVRVRAILGLELAAERYGLPAVAHAKQKVRSLNGAPQASLRTAAIRFFGAIKDVRPGPPAERSAFSFIAEAETGAADDGDAFSFGEAAEAKAEAVEQQEEEEEGGGSAFAFGEPDGGGAPAETETVEQQEEAPPAEPAAVVNEGGDE
jgi:hypothetical protein